MPGWMSQFFGRKSTSSNKHKTQVRARSKAQTPSNNSRYRAAIVYSRVECCDAARRISGQKFLAAHAPQLPLGGCSQPEQCQCRYKHLEDRRQEVRRDSDHGLPNRGNNSNERRSRRDRRRERPTPLSA